MLPKRVKIKGLKLENGLFKFQAGAEKITKPYMMQEPFLEGHDLPAFSVTSCWWTVRTDTNHAC